MDRGSFKNKNSYQQYRELGGIINEKDYRSAFDRAERATSTEKSSIAQAKVMARTAGISLRNPEDSIDQRIILYGVLRSDTNSDPKVKYHHSQMCDQRLFAEALRMLGDVDSLKKLIEAYPNISFNYKREE